MQQAKKKVEIRKVKIGEAGTDAACIAIVAGEGANPDYASFEGKKYQNNLGVIAQTPHGDGVWPVYRIFEDGRYVALEIRFKETDDESDKREEAYRKQIEEEYAKDPTRFRKNKYGVIQRL